MAQRVEEPCRRSLILVRKDRELVELGLEWGQRWSDTVPWRSVFGRPYRMLGLGPDWICHPRHAWCVKKEPVAYWSFKNTQGHRAYWAGGSACRQVVKTVIEICKQVLSRSSRPAVELVLAVGAAATTTHPNRLDVRISGGAGVWSVDFIRLEPGDEGRQIGNNAALELSRLTLAHRHVVQLGYERLVREAFCGGTGKTQTNKNRGTCKKACSHWSVTRSSFIDQRRGACKVQTRPTYLCCGSRAGQRLRHCVTKPMGFNGGRAGGLADQHDDSVQSFPRK